MTPQEEGAVVAEILALLITLQTQMTASAIKGWGPGIAGQIALDQFEDSAWYLDRLIKAYLENEKTKAQVVP